MINVKHLSLIVLSLISCGRQTSNTSFWNSTTGTYTIPSLEICYTVPSDVENWAIANIDSSIPEIKFCGVDNSTGVCIVIVEPDNTINSVAELDSVKIRNILHEIICQSPSGRILRFNPVIQRHRYAGSDSWRFNADIAIVNDVDTAFVSYSGYLFDCLNQKVAGIVSVSSTDIFESSDTNVLDKYFLGLHHLENN